jgi:hypothetical protein
VGGPIFFHWQEGYFSQQLYLRQVPSNQNRRDLLANFHNFEDLNRFG